MIEDRSDGGESRMRMLDLEEDEEAYVATRRTHHVVVLYYEGMNCVGLGETRKASEL
jgi:hypothetical protein